MLSCWLSCWLSDVFTASSPCTFCSLIEPVPKSGNSWVERPVSPNQLLERPAYNIYIHICHSYHDLTASHFDATPNHEETLWASKVSSDVMFNSWPGSVVKCGQGCYQINIYYNICRSALQTFQVLDFESLKSVLPAQPELTFLRIRFRLHCCLCWNSNISLRRVETVRIESKAWFFLYPNNRYSTWQ